MALGVARLEDQDLPVVAQRLAGLPRFASSRR
jgi:hypothetical protein